uniref:Mitochondrial import inner membrane translocase subunit TIM22-1-like n=1 Tax=Cicer arietinum TaxID=3827 RepID=A0A1S3EEU0_CICAR|nr:mitochondrial import inner membrane translocase subunit TIM22-1-like [Cicer arietinum]
MAEDFKWFFEIKIEIEKPQIEPIKFPTIEEICGQDIWNICAMRCVVTRVMCMIRGGIDIFMGLFLGALYSPLIQEVIGRHRLIYEAKKMGRRGWSSARAFAVMGLLFSVAEC